MNEKNPMMGRYEVIEPTNSYFVGFIFGYPSVESGLFLKEPNSPLEEALCFEFIYESETINIPREFLDKLNEYGTTEIYNPKGRVGKKFLDLESGNVKQFGTLTEPAIFAINNQLDSKR